MEPKLYKLTERGFEEVGLYYVIDWWRHTYPDDVFVNNPKEIVQIRNLMEKLIGEDRNITLDIKKEQRKKIVKKIAEYI